MHFKNERKPFLFWCDHYSFYHIIMIWSLLYDVIAGLHCCIYQNNSLTQITISLYSVPDFIFQCFLFMFSLVLHSHLEKKKKVQSICFLVPIGTLEWWQADEGAGQDVECSNHAATTKWWLDTMQRSATSISWLCLSVWPWDWGWNPEQLYPSTLSKHKCN